MESESSEPSSPSTFYAYGPVAPGLHVSRASLQSSKDSKDDLSLGEEVWKAIGDSLRVAFSSREWELWWRCLVSRVDLDNVFCVWKEPEEGTQERDLETSAEATVEIAKAGFP